MGAFVNTNLLPGEQVVYETHHHWIIFISLKGLLSLFILPLVVRLTHEFVITNQRVIIKTGFLGLHTIEIPFRQVESVQIHQGVLAYILGYGDIIVIGIGGSLKVFPTISRPIRFRREFQQATLTF